MAAPCHSMPCSHGVVIAVGFRSLFPNNMSVILLKLQENPHIYRAGKCYRENGTALAALPVRLLPWLGWRGMFFLWHMFSVFTMADSP